MQINYYLILFQLFVAVGGPSGRLRYDYYIPLFTSFVGENVPLRCDIANADWSYVKLSLSTTDYVDITEAGRLIANRTTAKYSIETATDGSVLIVKEARSNDSGLYVCFYRQQDEWSQYRHIHLEIAERADETTTSIIPSNGDIASDVGTRSSEKTINNILIIVSVVLGGLVVAAITIAYFVLCRQRNNAAHAHTRGPESIHLQEVHDIDDDPVTLPPRQEELQELSIAGDKHLGPDQNPDVVSTVGSENQEVSCFVKLASQFFLVNRAKQEILVYKELPVIEVGRIPIPDVSLPAAFTASETSGCLYLSDRVSNGYVWVIKPQETVEESTVEKWKKFDIENETAQSMAATHDNRILILVAIGLWDTKSWHGRIEVYQQREDPLVRDIAAKLPDRFLNPWCAVYTKKKTFLVSYGLHRHTLFGSGVCEVTAEGTPIKFCENVNFYIPVSICSNLAEDMSLVVDMLNCRIIILETAELKVREVALNWCPRNENEGYDILHVPTRLFYDEKKNHVYVGFQSGKVQIYKIDLGTK